MPRSNPKIPTANEEALQQPSVDPIFLVTSALTGGLSGFAEGPNLVPKLLKAEEAGDEDVPYVLKHLKELMNSPRTAKLVMEKYGGVLPHLTEGLKSAAESAGNFAGSTSLNNLLDPGHPLANNVLGLPLLPNYLRNVVPNIYTVPVANEFDLFDEYPILRKLSKSIMPASMLPKLLSNRQNGR